MSEAINFKMLVVAREARGLTQLELVSKITNLNQGNYSKMEKGLLPVPAETLNSISDLLEFPKSFFLKKEPIHEPGNHYYRKRASLPRKTQSQLEAKIKCLIIWVDSFLDDIEIPTFNIPEIRVNDNNQPDIIAHKIRGFMGLPSGPVNNLINVLEKHGVIVYFIRDTSEKFDGMTMFTNSGQPIIIVNEILANDRKRFTLAHELGHLVMHLRGLEIDTADKELERQANDFAGEFLVPYLDSRADLSGVMMKDLGILKQYWMVSKASLLYLANKRCLISPNRYQNMMIELSRNGERKFEGVPIEIDKPSILSKMADAYLNELEYSLPEMELTIGIKEKDFDYFIKQKPIEHKLRLVI